MVELCDLHGVISEPLQEDASYPDDLAGMFKFPYE